MTPQIRKMNLVLEHLVGKDWVEFCQRVRTDGATPCWCFDGCDCFEVILDRFEAIQWLFRHHYWSRLWP